MDFEHIFHDVRPTDNWQLSKASTHKVLNDQLSYESLNDQLSCGKLFPIKELRDWFRVHVRYCSSLCCCVCCVSGLVEVDRIKLTPLLQYTYLGTYLCASPLALPAKDFSSAKHRHRTTTKNKQPTSANQTTSL